MLTLSLHDLPPGPLAFSPCGTLLAVGGPYTRLRMYDVAGGVLLWQHPPQVTALYGGQPVFTVGGRGLAQRGHPGEWFDPQTGRPVPAPADPPHVGVHHPSPCRRWEIAAGFGTVREWQRGREIALYRAEAKPTGRKAVRGVPIHLLSFHGFTPDGELVAGSYRDWLLVLRPAALLAVEANRPTVVPTVAAHRLLRNQWQDAAFTPDGRALLGVSNEGRVRVYDAVTWAERPSYDFRAGPLKCVAVSPDGLRAAAAGTKKIVVWDLDC